MTKTFFKKITTGNNLIILGISVIWGIMALIHFSTVLNKVFDFTDIVWEGGIIFGKNVLLKENIVNILYVLILFSAVILFVLRKKIGWILLAICMVWHIGTLILFDLEQLNSVLYEIHVMHEYRLGLEFGELGPVEWSQSFPQFLTFTSLGNAVSSVVKSQFLSLFITTLCKMLVGWVFQCALLWLICVKRIRNIYNISIRVAILSISMTVLLKSVLYIVFGSLIFLVK
jgi:hypothetical protein